MGVRLVIKLYDILAHEINNKLTYFFFYFN